MEGVISDPLLQGIIPRAVQALFDGSKSIPGKNEFIFQVNYVEIYLEKI